MIAFLPPLGTRVPRGRAWLRVTRWVDEASDEAGGQTVEKLSCLCAGAGGCWGGLKADDSRAVAHPRDAERPSPRHTAHGLCPDNPEAAHWPPVRP